MGNFVLEESYEVVKEKMKTEAFWLRFFIRPCGPRPSKESTLEKTADIRSDVSSRDDYTDAQKESLIAIIDEKENWYISRFCATERFSSKRF